MTEQELKRKVIASMDNCYLEIGTPIKGVIQKQAIPPALREKIYDQILIIIKEAGYVRLAEDQSLPDVPDVWQKVEREFEAYCAGQNSLLLAVWRGVILEVKDGS